MFPFSLFVRKGSKILIMPCGELLFGFSVQSNFIDFYESSKWCSLIKMVNSINETSESYTTIIEQSNTFSSYLAARKTLLPNAWIAISLYSLDINTLLINLDNIRFHVIVLKHGTCPLEEPSVGTGLEPEGNRNWGTFESSWNKLLFKSNLFNNIRLLRHAPPFGQLTLEIHNTTKTREAKRLCPIRCLEQRAVDDFIGLFVEGAETW